MSKEKAIWEAAKQGKYLLPVVRTSSNYQHWVSRKDARRCQECGDLQGKIWLLSEIPEPIPPEETHFYCRCEIRPMEAILAGTATIQGPEGADLSLLRTGLLPEYYVKYADARAKGWDNGKWPSNFVPRRMITMGIYHNRNGHLPQAPGRIWQEADINYTAGKRNNQRVLWSNDGLVFVTYDHYETFYEIVP